MEKVRISIVSYLNTTSFLYGIEQNRALAEKIELYKDIPSECARKLKDNEVDLGLVPVAIIPQLKEAHIVSDYCIGAEGKVKSVLLVSDVPLREIESIYLDYHSRTSVALCRLLCQEHWKISPDFKQADKDYISKISGTTAGVIIGDRTFHLEKEYKYTYDLAEAWQHMTSLPFVFAAWVSNRKLPEEFISTFNRALLHGLQLTDKAVENSATNQISKNELKEYLTKYIKFTLDDKKKEALDLFLSKLK